MKKEDFLRCYIYEKGLYGEQYGDAEFYNFSDDYMELSQDNQTGYIKCVDIELSPKMVFQFMCPNDYNDLVTVLNVLLKFE